MSYNLTEMQAELARWIVGKIREQKLGETFRAVIGGVGKISFDGLGEMTGVHGRLDFGKIQAGTFEALIADGMFVRQKEGGTVAMLGGRQMTVRQERTVLTATRRLFDAVDSNFADDEVVAPLSTLAHTAPPELNLSLDRLRRKYPDPAKLGFLVMRFTSGKAFSAIVTAIKETATKHGISIVRADEHEFHADLWGNVRTFLHGCSFGVTVYERIEQDEPNANVGLEIGYLLAMSKPVLLLKERTVKTLQADLMGKLYKEFDEHDPEGSIPGQLTKWLVDNGVVVSPAV